MTHLPTGPTHGCLPPLCHIVYPSSHLTAANGMPVWMLLVVGGTLGVLGWAFRKIVTQ